MAIIAPQTAPNFTVGDYWRLQKAELLCSPEEPEPRWHYVIGFYRDAAARDNAPALPMWSAHIFVPISQIAAGGGADPRDLMYQQIMADPMFAGTNAASDAVDASQPSTSGTVSATTG